jgi:hypothetical protein
MEPGGGVRSIAAGVRVVAAPGGTVAASSDRLPGAKWAVIPLAERLGGGFLFVVDDRSLWRADKWLAPARAIYASTTPIARVAPGLDRVYVLAGGWHAIDGATGRPMPLGPWPSSPTVTAYAAADGWRALAIADLRGPLATFDAGANWRAIHLPIEPRDVRADGDALLVDGIEPGRGLVTYEVRSGGSVARIADARASDIESPRTGEAPGPLGVSTLSAAVEDGWPLDDGTALVARDGALLRVRLEDGAVVESAPRAFPLRLSRCHPVPLAQHGSGAQKAPRPGVSLPDAPGVGFVCGEPRGKTVIYALDVDHGRMVQVRSFDEPRAVLASGTGSLVVRGPCDAHGRNDADPGAHHYCIHAGAGEPWREIRVEGAVGGERAVGLADGRFVIVSPPQGNLDAARLTVVDSLTTQKRKNGATSVPIVFPSPTGPDAAATARVLDVGVWLDGFEERRPGVLGGWIEAAGMMVGVEIALDGSARLGRLVKEAGVPMVSGRYGLGWTAARTAFETTDGGMTWLAIDVPQPLKPPREVESRGCGPIGCTAAGWIRIGWGDETQSDAGHAPPLPVTRPRSTIAVSLDCDGAAPKRTAVSDLSPFAPPLVSQSERLQTFDAVDLYDGSSRVGAMARVFAWGPKTGDWELAAKWSVRWVGTYGAPAEQHASAPAPLAPLLFAASQAGYGNGLGAPPFFRVVVADDEAHALLTVRRPSHQDMTVFALEPDRVPVEVKRGDGEPFADVDGAVFVGDRWYLSTPPSPASAPTDAIVWAVEGTLARELARVPRLQPSPGSRVSPGRLALRNDGRTLGFVVVGQPSPEWSGPTRWVMPVDLDTGALGDVESLGLMDLGDRRLLPACRPDDAGWSVDMTSPLPFRSVLSSHGSIPTDLRGAVARVRLTPARACLERLAGVADGGAVGAAPAKDGDAQGGTISVVAESGRERRILRCAVR